VETTKSRETLPAQNTTVAQMFIDRVAKTPDREAFRKPTEEGGWHSYTWKEAYDEVAPLAAGLLALGLKTEERVGIASNTRLDWVYADLAIMLAGGATTTVYPSTGEEDVEYILSDADVVIAFAEDASQVAKLQAVKGKLPDLRQVIVFDGEGDGDWVISLADLKAKGEELLAKTPDVVHERSASISPDNLATLIYTSGTTGRPKGVELLHSNWTYEGAAIDAVGILNENDVQFLWLPLAHSFGKVLEAAQLQIGFATAVDGRVPKIVENLPVVQPTFMAGVPRIFEKVYAGAIKNGTAEGGVKAKIFNWAFEVGKREAAKKNAGQNYGGWQYNLANKLVFSKLHEKMGGRIRYFVSGSAALSGTIAEWFDAAGLTILEGYGLTETSAATCIMRPDNVQFGTVGEPMAGTEIAIADDGEILVRGPGVMRGYRNLPEANAEVFEQGDGWFSTGDIGTIDEKGRVKITDRKKDLVKTSGGKYIAPSAIEGKFKAIFGLAQALVVHANNRNFASALVALDSDAVLVWAQENGMTATWDAGSVPADWTEAQVEEFKAIADSDQMKATVNSAIEQLNTDLNKWETIKKFEILEAPLSIDSGELTPSLKVKRKVVEDKYQGLLDAMYA
jgi:long-chain acyl-CoA synthetase